MRRLLSVSVAATLALAGVAGGVWLVAGGSATAQTEAASPAPAASLVPLRPQPAGVPWPTEAWPTGQLPSEAGAAVTAQLDQAFATADGPAGQTRALLVVQGGRIVAERYAQGFNADSQLVSWSMAKSVTAALAGIAVADGKLTLDSSIAPPQWREGDRRRSITLRNALQMADGLDWREENYASPIRNDAARMLFGPGREDIVDYVAGKSLKHTPGTHWNYSSGTSNLVAAAVAQTLQPWGLGDPTGREHMRNFMVDRLFRPIGMSSVAPEFDAAGNFYGSSLVHATARDWARFGYLHLRDGVWNGQRILPEGWVDFVRTPAIAEGATQYGAHWWLSPANREGLLKDGPYDSFEAQGFQGQVVMVIPSKDAVIVRLGFMEREEGWDALGTTLQAIVTALPDPA
jgi:CubicO group peptidase (beta-lactamase class C family)